MAQRILNSMSEERMGEIALMYVRNKIRKDSVSLDPERIRREVGNTAKELGIEKGEALQFASNLLFDAFSDVISGLDKK